MCYNYTCSFWAISQMKIDGPLQTWFARTFLCGRRENNRWILLEKLKVKC